MLLKFFLNREQLRLRADNVYEYFSIFMKFGMLIAIILVNVFFSMVCYDIEMVWVLSKEAHILTLNDVNLDLIPRSDFGRFFSEHLLVYVD